MKKFNEDGSFFLNLLIILVSACICYVSVLYIIYLTENRKTIFDKNYNSILCKQEENKNG